MRTGISLTVTPAIRRHLKAVAANRNNPQKHVWRAQIVLLSAAGVGTNEIIIIAAVKRGHQVLDSIH